MDGPCDEGDPSCMDAVHAMGLYCRTLQVDTLDEATISQKIGVYKTHQSTMDFCLENFEQSVTRFKAMLEG